MKTSKFKTNNIFKCVVIQLFFLMLFISSILSQNLKLEKVPYKNYQAPIYKDISGKIYSNLITARFKEEIFIEKSREESINYENLLFKTKEIKNLFDGLYKSFGSFKIDFLFPDYKFGKNLRWNKRLKKMVEVPDLSQVIIINFNNNIPIDSAISILKSFSSVVYAHGPIISETLTTPNDTYFGPTNQWYLERINASKAWDVTKGRSSIRIDINDDYVERDEYNNALPLSQQITQKHVDINTKIVQEFGVTSGQYGGHGTLVMGIAGSLTNNQEGIASLGWNLSISKSVYADVSQIMTVINSGADIINMSWYVHPAYQSFSDVIETALTRGVICVSAAGNSFKQISSTDTIGPPFLLYPAAYNFGSTIGQVIAVSGTMIDQIPNGTENYISWIDGSGNRKYYNYCPGNNPITDPTSAFIDVAAPGGCITTTARYNEYLTNYVWGTSLAAPQVSALCGLILSLNDGITPPQVYDIITKTADKIGSAPYDANGWNRYLGYGRINAYKALKYTCEHYNITFNQNIIIPAGETWNISPGVTWKFEPGTNLTVYGTLNAIGTASNRITFNSNSPSNKWGGIIFSGSGAGNSVLSYCDINNVQVYGSGAVTLLNVSGTPEINYCNISNNNTGGTAGVYYSNSGGYIYRNKIMNNSNAGVHCANYSSPASSKTGVYHQQSNGNNVITGNLYGIYASYYSNPYFGSSGMSQYGYNTINNTSGSSLNVYATNGCQVSAEYNWWGNNPPLSNKFTSLNGSVISYGSWLSSAPTVPFSKMNTMKPISNPAEVIAVTDDLLNTATKYRLEQKYSEAVNIYKSLINSSTKSGEINNSIAGLLNVFRENKDYSIIKYLESLNNFNKEVEVIRLISLLNAYALDGEIEKINSITSAITKQYPKSEHEKFALLQLAYLNKFNKKDDISTNLILDEITTKFPIDNDIKTALWILQGKKDDNGENNKNISKDSVNSTNPDVNLSNYPNPFNPSTNICFNLPVSSHVSLKIFDVLGKEVRTLLNEYRSEGNHTIHFDASNLAGGVYYYKLSFDNKEITKKLLYMK